MRGMAIKCGQGVPRKGLIGLCAGGHMTWSKAHAGTHHRPRHRDGDDEITCQLTHANGQGHRAGRHAWQLGG